MRSFRALAAALVLATATSAGTTLPSYADPSRPAPQPPQGVVQAADQALENAQAALTGEGELEPTLALVELVEALPELGGADRRAAEDLLARPDGDAPQFSGEPRYPAGADRAHCGRHVCVHYVRTGTHRVNLTDRDRDGVPDWVESNLSVMERTWNVEIGKLGYRAPRRDGSRGNIPGKPRTRGKIDVYLAQLSEGLFGYAQPESDPSSSSDGSRRTSTAHMVLDADFAGFDCKPSICLKATAAHEFFHVVQFGYDTFENTWFLESTATWMEERVFDGANDNRSYLPASSMHLPADSIDTDSPPTWYGNWVFHEFYSQRIGNSLVRKTWERARPASVNARQALHATLLAHGSSLHNMYAKFAAASNAPGKFWEEGAAAGYPAATLPRPVTLSAGLGSTRGGTVTADHLASGNRGFEPGAGLSSTSRLQITVNAPASTSTASVLVQRTNGSVQLVVIRLDASGAGTATIAFDPATVARVVLNLGNGSTADNRVTSYQVAALA